MAQPRSTIVRLSSFAGGLNDTDPPHRIQDVQLVAATDVELTSSGGVVRRSGIARAMGPPTTGVSFEWLQRHTPSQALSSQEVWAIPINGGSFYRSTTGTTWSTVSVSDAGGTTFGTVTDAVSFNGKLYVAYRKAANTDRLHVWDGSSLRRVGISTPSAPTAADTGAGSYAATVRYYKVQFYYQDASSRVTYSDLSPALTFTPSGSGTGVVVTRSAAPDSAAGWRVWASPDNVSYYLIQAGQAIGTTTYTDSAAPSSYSTASTVIAPEAGAYTPPWSAKYLLVDENRLLIAGAFETTRYASRIGWSSILGTAATAYAEPVIVNDDERFLPDNYLDLDSDEGGEITGMETLNGSVYVFKRYAIYKLVRTGDASIPYKPVTISKVIGALSRKSIVPGEDAAGGPCLYFLSERGPYRLGGNGLEDLGRTIKATWDTVVTLPASWLARPHGVYETKASKVRWWVQTAASGPDLQLIFHAKTGGWTTSPNTIKPNFAACSALLPEDLSSRESALLPHVLHSTGAWGYPPVVWKVVTSQASDDVVNASGAVAGTESFTPTFTTKTLSLGMGDRGGVRDTYLAAVPSAGGTTFSVTLSRDFGAETRSATVDFTGTTTRMPQQVPGLTLASAQYVGVTVSSATQAAWAVDEIAMRVHREEPV